LAPHGHFVSIVVSTLSKGGTMRLLGLALAVIVFGQPGTSVTGTWTASYRGTIYIRLALADGSSTPQGTMSIGHSINVDADGNVNDATPSSAPAKPMTDVRWNGSVLSFAIDDDGDVDTFEFRLVDANHAELRIVFSDEQRQDLAAEHTPLPKPFPLTKAR
jgi:hypothetical protein